MAEAIEAVGRMVACYPHADAERVGKGYVGAMASVLAEYPRSVAMACADVRSGVVRSCKFLPTIAEVVAWCEPEVARLRRVTDYDARSARQLCERDQLEREANAETPEHRAAVVERIRCEMAAAGMPFDRDRRHYHGETPATVMAKLGVTQAQWDAIPNAPQRADYWRGLRWE
jgi:hypothetical protein